MARAVQAVSGARYQAALNEVQKRWDEIIKLKEAHPEMTRADCAVAVCFEDRDELLKRWGPVFA